MNCKTHKPMSLYEVVTLLGEQLNHAGVLWALGSSFVLKTHGLVEKPRDIDIFVDLKDWDKAVAVMNQYGSSQERVPKWPYETACFKTYALSSFTNETRSMAEGELSDAPIELDLISGFAVRHSKGLFSYNLAEEDALEWRPLIWEAGNASLPFMKIEDWYVMYQLIPEREKKVRDIEKYLSRQLDAAFRERNSKNDDNQLANVLSRIDLWSKSNLPDAVMKRTQAFCHRHRVHTFRCSVAYDGKSYFGWQTQKNLATVQETLEKTIAKVIGHRVDIHGSGRTDAGVHARGQVFSLITVMPLPLENFLTAVNRLLPKSIVLNSAEEVHSSFHARFDATGKTYRYRIWNCEERDVFESEYSWHVPQPLNEEHMKRAAIHMIGTHDFRSFMASGSDIVDTVRTVFDVTLQRKGNTIEIDFVGNGFLYNMVRIMTGLLVEVGLGKRKPEEIAAIIAAEDRTRAPLTAPAQGLYLMHVKYEE